MPRYKNIQSCLTIVDAVYATVKLIGMTLPFDRAVASDENGDDVDGLNF